MEITVTIYLKSGGNTSVVVICESMKELKNDYRRDMSSPVIVHEMIDGGSIQIIPTDNIACITFEKVE